MEIDHGPGKYVGYVNELFTSLQLNYTCIKEIRSLGTFSRQSDIAACKICHTHICCKDGCMNSHST